MIKKYYKEGRLIQLNGNQYQELAMRTLNPDVSDNDLIVDGVMGLCGESGELCDLVKKFRFQGKPFDASRAAFELGDVIWYVALCAKALGYSLDEIMIMNIEKLKARYPDGFNVDKSENRKSNDV